MLRSRFALCFLAGLLLAALPLTAAGPDTNADDERTLRQAKVALDGPSLLAFFRSRTLQADDEQIKDLIVQLGDESFPAREQASQTLTALGGRAVPHLRRAAGDADAEVRRRAEECLRRIEQDTSVEAVAAARLLALRRPSGAAQALLDYLPVVVAESAADEIHTALAVVGVRDGKPEPVLVKALTDGAPARRAAAGVALCRAGVTEHKDAVRKLLDDPEPGVRLAVGRALLDRREKEGVPALIGLLDQLPRRRIGAVEEMLYRLAEEKAPALAMGDTAESRQRFREAWADWWKANQASVDLKRLDPAPFLDRTLVLLLELGTAMELDADDKPIWQMDKLAFPLDAQMLPGERLLVAEHNGGRVSERHRSGAILWERNADGPLVAQRLPNGSTFIATKTELCEVDRAGNEVFSYRRHDGDQFMRAVKLPNGDVACVIWQGQRYIRLSAAGKELHSFGVSVNTFGGRLDVQPDGRVLIPSMRQNRLFEYDVKGQVVREYAIPKPVAAVRLANGNLLVTSMNQTEDAGRALEFDPAGKQIWQYDRSDVRVNRAFRR